MDTLRRFLIVPLAGAAALAFTGCGNEESAARDEASQALASAGQSFEVLAADPTVPFATATQEGLLTDVTTGVGRLGTGSLPEQQAAGKAMSAEASIGLSRLNHATLIAAQQTQAGRVTTATRLLDHVLQLDATIQANAGADSSVALETIAEEEQAARSLRSSSQQAVNELRADIADLESRLQAELQQTSQLREEAAIRRESARDVPLDRRISVLEEARRIDREADSHQVRAAHLEGEVAALRPDLAAAEAYLNEADDQLASLAAARQAVEAERSRVEADTRTKRTELAELIEKLGETLTEINRARSENTEIFDQVATHADNAVDAAESAQRGLGRGEISQAASARVTAAQMWKSQVHWDRVTALTRQQTLMERLVESSSLLGRANQDQATLDDLNATIAELKQTALETARAAAETYESIADDENDPVLASLQSRVSVISGEGPILADRPTTSDRPADPGAGSPTVGPSESPRVLLEQLVELGRTGDFDSMIDLIHAETATERTLLDSLRTIASAMSTLDQAVRQQFNESMTEIMEDPQIQRQIQQMAGDAGAGMDLSSMGMDFNSISPVDPDVNLDDVIIRTSSDGTFAFIDSGELSGIEMVYRDGQWKLSLASLDLGGGGAVDVPVEVMNLLAEPMSTVFTTVAADVRDDMFSTPAMMVNSLMTQLGLAFVDIAPQLMEMLQESMSDEDMQRMIDEQMGGAGG